MQLSRDFATVCKSFPTTSVAFMMLDVALSLFQPMTMADRQTGG
jgi:hypothetical protein